MDKVLLPKKVADSIHYFQTKGKERTLFNVPTIASSSTKNKNSKVIHDYIQASDENFKNYFNALVNGYEVEVTKEEYLKRYYENMEKGSQSDDVKAAMLCNAKRITILTVLNTLGIEIEGVNK